jgi:hypothetical protein
MLLASATTLPLVLAAAGCRSSEVFDGPDPLGGPPPLSPGVITLEAVIAAEASLIQAYQTAIGRDARPAAQRGDLTTLLTQHQQHQAQLYARLVIPPGYKGRLGVRSALGEGGGGPALAQGAGLAQLERESAAGLVRQLATAEPSLAQLFASIAACHATHVAALGG